MERIGVLFVHGAGRQEPSSTVRTWGEALIEWLNAWHADPDRQPGLGGDHLRITLSRLSYGNELARGEPAHVRLRIPAYTDPGSAARTWPPSEWVLTEGSSASRVQAPDLGRIALWSLRIYLRVIFRLLGAVSDRVARRIQAGVPHTLRLRIATGMSSAPRAERGGIRSWIDRAGLVLLAIGYALAAAVGYVFVVLPLAMIAQIPIGLVRAVALVYALRRFLLENIGDFYTYLYDEIQALHIRRGIIETIRWLDAQGCDRICIAAHSHGTVVAYDALTQTDRAPAPPEGVAKVTKLVTLGEALNHAIDLKPEGMRRLDLAQHGLGSRVRWVDMWSVYDPVPGAAVSIPGATSVEVTNRMDVLVDHFVYLENEQVLARLAQEIDAPASGDRSRFDLADARARDEARQERVRTLFAWRLTGVALVVAAVIGRGLIGGADAILQDGSGILELAARVPVVGAIASLIASIPQLQRPVALVLALAAYLTVYQIAYVVALQLWKRWDARARASAVRLHFRRAPLREHVWVWLASVATLATFVDAAALIVGR